MKRIDEVIGQGRRKVLMLHHQHLKYPVQYPLNILSASCRQQHKHFKWGSGPVCVLDEDLEDLWQKEAIIMKTGEAHFIMVQTRRKIIIQGMIKFLAWLIGWDFWSGLCSSESSLRFCTPAAHPVLCVLRWIKLICRDPGVCSAAAALTGDINRALPLAASCQALASHQISDATQTCLAGKQKHIRR